jgi:hypothetical protein
MFCFFTFSIEDAIETKASQFLLRLFVPLVSTSVRSTITIITTNPITMSTPTPESHRHPGFPPETPVPSFANDHHGRGT